MASPHGVSRLCGEAAVAQRRALDGVQDVHGAAAGTGVDDAAEVEAARCAGDGDAVRGLVEFVARGVAEKV